MTEEVLFESLVLPSAIHREILRHARELAPREAVGLLGGRRGGECELAIRLRNLSRDDRAFLADPYEQFQGLRLLESRGLELLAIYHSHPAGGTEPSPSDLAFARSWTCLHLIMALDRPGRPDGECRAFAISEGGSVRFVPVTLAEAR